MMDFASTLKNGCVVLALKSTTKSDLIEEMVDILVAAGKISDRAAAIQAVMDREQKMSTGMQLGVAFPHGKTDTVQDLVVLLALKKEGVDFASLDGQPSRIFVMTLSPITRTGPHIEYLAQIGRRLDSARVRARLLEARTAQEIIGILQE